MLRRRTEAPRMQAGHTGRLTWLQAYTPLPENVPANGRVQG